MGIKAVADIFHTRRRFFVVVVAVVVSGGLEWIHLFPGVSLLVTFWSFGLLF